MCVLDLKDLNLCLLPSWVQRYHTTNQKMWKDIVDCKYQTNSPNLFYCPNRHSSPFWKGVLCAAKGAKMGLKWKIGNGWKAKFWEDH
jgi:hypothetical protein